MRPIGLRDKAISVVRAARANRLNGGRRCPGAVRHGPHRSDHWHSAGVDPGPRRIFDVTGRAFPQHAGMNRLGPRCGCCSSGERCLRPLRVPGADGQLYDDDAHHIDRLSSNLAKVVSEIRSL